MCFQKQFQRDSILMKIRERYIRKTLANFTLVVLVIWLGLYSFFNFLSEMSSIGQVNYTILEACLLYTSPSPRDS